MKFVRETAKAWVAGIGVASGTLTAVAADGIVTAPEAVGVLLAGAGAWFAVWAVPNGS